MYFEYLKDDGTADIIDTISGKTLLTGYQQYSVLAVPGEGIYIIADNFTGSYDIYLVK